MAALFTASKFSATDANGNPLAAGKVFTYAAGTLTPKATYTTQAGDVANANPVILDSTGRANIWLGSGAYKFVVQDSTGATAPDGTVDNISAIANDLSASSGSSLVGHIATGTGAVARTAQAKLREVVSIADFGADLTGVTNSTAAVQAAHDAIVASGKKGVLLFNPGTVKCNSGLTINTLWVEVQGFGCTLDFSGLTSGVALTITGNGQVEIAGLRLEGNSATGSVTAISMIGGGAGSPVSAISFQSVSITGFGKGMVWGDHCYLCEFHNLIVGNCLITVDSLGVTNAGAAMRMFGGILVNQVSGGTVFRNTNQNLHLFLHGTVLDCDGKNVDFSAGLIELHGTLVEPADFAAVPFQLTGSTTSMRMYGGVITVGASPTTAGTLVSCDSTCVNGAFFDGVRIDVITGTRYLVSGTGAANVNFEGCISANRHSLLGNKLADGGFENGAVLYGSADGSNRFGDLVSITVDNGGLPATSLVTGTNLALTFSTTTARTGTKSLRCAKSAAAAAPAAFGIFCDISPEGRPSGRIYYKKPGTEAGTMSISMGFYTLQLDGNGVPIIQRQSLTLAATVVFTSAAVDWTEVGLYDLYVPPWATHYGISVNVGSMPASSIYFDDAEINIL